MMSCRIMSSINCMQCATWSNVYLCVSWGILCMLSKHVKDTELNLWWSWIKLQFHQREFVDDQSNTLYEQHAFLDMNMVASDFIEGLSFLSTHLEVHMKNLLHHSLLWFNWSYVIFKIWIMTSQCSITTADWCKLDKYRYV